jgi:dTDP-4-dehydrorhamnose 3,5-epimerase
MRFTEGAVAGSFVIDMDPKGDDRGFFARAWCRDELQARGLVGSFVQCNDSFSAQRGTLRGLHCQRSPYDEVKLIRCIRGAVFDVLVDLRRDSPTFLRWFGTELTGENRRMLYVPAGCAHGYLTLEDATEVMYPVSHVYIPAAEIGVRWNDARFGIKWPDAGALTISPKDSQWPDYVV